MTLLPLLLLLADTPAVAPPVPAPVGPQSWVTNEDYPPAAMRAGASGTVGFRLDVDAAGAVTGCTIVASSGSEILDRATCDLMIRRARFAAARDAKGAAIASTWSSRIRWELPHDGQALDVPGPGATLYRFELNRDGSIAGCTAWKTGSASVAPEEDACLNPAPNQAYLRQLAPRYRIVTIASGTGLDVPLDSILPPIEGELLLRRAVELSGPASPAGKPLCRTTAAVGGGLPAAEMCETLRAKGLAEIAQGPERGPKLVIDFAVRGIPR